LLHEDASEYAFPADGPLLVFMFNPFGPDIMRMVMANLAESLRLTPRRAFIVYYFPTQAGVVEEVSGFDTLERNERFAVYEHSPLRVA